MNTDQIARNALEQWNTRLRAICGRFETDLAFNRSLFIGEICTWTRSGLELASLRTNAGNIVRQAGNADLDNDQDCFLVSQRSGYSQITQHGISIKLAPGDMLLMDSSGYCEITPFGLIEHASLSLPRQDVLKGLKNQRLAFGKVSAAKTCGRMLHVLMDQICKDTRDDESVATDEHGLQNALISLLPSALEHSDEACTDLSASGSVNLRSCVQKLIDESLGQPGLNPAVLAGRLNISVRHLYRLFEDEGDSVCRYIQRARLKRSAEDLANPFLRSESITTIAYKWGFTDSAHFSRSFKKQFEQSPKDFRSVSLTHAAGAA
ncbi:transcriptional regulator FeaR [Pseudomonas sp. LJDD11]|uniref:transcriptional regulator FeaR n=1 Tax=Pseudomonas sp. LJDD11 TaxID=2931984 RepID=UPI00211BF51B|nr:transcriptional regulator FeaR [Pseudomonas sp. LJDD11]MCQ9424850.1 transcriptional regulator FeaR [Pseudomonas sp. LJDD11]